MRPFITGAAGFIRSTLVDSLVAEGHQVVGVDNLSMGVAANLEHALRCNGTSPGRSTFVRADIQAPELTHIVAGTNHGSPTDTTTSNSLKPASGPH